MRLELALLHDLNSIQVEDVVVHEEGPALFNINIAVHLTYKGRKREEKRREEKEKENSPIKRSLSLFDTANHDACHIATRVLDVEGLWTKATLIGSIISTPSQLQHSFSRSLILLIKTRSLQKHLLSLCHSPTIFATLTTEPTHLTLIVSPTSKMLRTLI